MCAALSRGLLRDWALPRRLCMWFLKKSLLGLALVVGAVCSSFAGEPTYETDVYPLQFNAKPDSVSESDWKAEQLEKWNRLMKYKLFATGIENSTGITFNGQSIYITDSVGYVGSAKGNFTMVNTNHSIGGPVLFGGTFVNGDGTDSILTGPTRFEKNFSPTFNSKDKNYFAGNYCFDGGYNAANTTPGITKGGGSILDSAHCANGDIVYKVDSDLDVPTLGVSWPDSLPTISSNNNIAYIHVPPTCDGVTYTAPKCVGDTGTAYTYYINSVNFGNNPSLYVVMPPGGRLTKIYVKNGINLSTAGENKIVVVYAEGQTWNGTKWSGEGSYTPLTNSEYGGNLLFYMPGSFTIPTSQKTMQGTYISGGDISLGQHTQFAGQLLAKTIVISHDFAAKDFKYVPFNPPQIGLDMAVNQEISESDHSNVAYQDGSGNYTGTVLDIKLTKTPTTDVTFKYCFAFNGTGSTPTLASLNDVCTTSADASGVSGCHGGFLSIPICGSDTSSARIAKGTKVTESPIKIWVNNDSIIENRQEFFTLKIFDLTGGVFSDNSRSWPVSMQIIDNDNGAPCGVESHNNSVTIPEDTPILLANGAFPAQCSDGLGLSHYVIITSLPAVGSLTYQGTKVTVNQRIPSSNLTSLKFTPALNQYGTPYATIGFKIEDPNPVNGSTVGPYTLTINVTPVNDAPIASNVNVTVPENTTKDSVIVTNARYNVSDVENDPLKYSIIYGNDGVALDVDGNPPFAIDTSTGAISVNGKLDYERISFYPLLVQISDGVANTVVSVNVTIADVNEPPIAVNCTTSVSEAALLKTYTGCWINAVDPEGTVLKYSITGGTGKADFTIDSLTGNIYTAAALDYERQKKYTLTVTIKDKNGKSGYKSTTAMAIINITDVNEPPSAPSDTCWIEENKTSPFYTSASKTSTKTCKIQGFDPEGKSLSYTIAEGNTNGTFAINSSTGVITASKAPDYESQSAFYLFVDVSDGVNTAVRALALIKVIDENEAPTAKDTTCTIAENSAINMFTGCWIEAHDQDGDSLRYEITSATQNGTDYLKVDAYGNIMVKEYIDYDTMGDKFFDLTITVSDGRGKSTTATARVKITDENEAPSVKTDTCWIAENTKTPFYTNANKTSTKTCKVLASDPEGKTLSYTIDGSTNPDGMFAIARVSDGGKITASKTPDYETVSDYTLIINVSDGVKTSKTIAVIHVINENEPPTAKVDGASIYENSSVNTYVTWVDASDIEDEYKLTYEIISGNDDGAFKIVSSGQGNPDDGNILVARGDIDYESLPDGAKFYTLSIKVCDLGTPGAASNKQCVTKTVQIDIENGNEKPTISGIPDQTIDEHTDVGTVVGTVAGSDPENGKLTYSFAGGNNGQAFAIDPLTGEITVARDIDFEALADTVFKIKVIVRDDGGLTDETFVNISIRDINEGADIDNTTMAVAENQPKGTTVGTLELYDPDTKNENLQNTFQAIGGDKDLFTIDSKTGVIKTNAVFDYESKTTYSLVVRVYDQDGNADTATVTIKITDVKETSSILVTYAETGSGAENWTNPVGTLYTNENSMLLQWTADGKQMPDTLLTNLKEGFNVVTLTYTDPTKNTGVTETIGIFVSTRTPEVTVTTAASHETGANIYTLVETVDESDTSVYVNKKNNDIVITVKEPVLDQSYTDSTCNYETHSFTVNTELEPVTIPSSTYDAVNKVVAAGPVLNTNPNSEVTYSQYNGNQIKVSYTEKVAGVDVVISYITDREGNVEKIPVIGANGKIDSIEVITVSYQVNVGGKVVNVSYLADAATGQALKTTTVNNGSGSSSASNSGSNGGSNSGKPGSNSGSNSGSNGGSSSGKPGSNSGSNGGNGGSGSAANNGGETGNSAPVYMYSLTEGEVLFSVTYDYTTKVKGMGETTVQVSYTVDQKGKVTKDKDGNVGYEVSYTYVNEMGNSSTQSVYIVVDLIPPKVKIESPNNDDVLHSNMVEVKWCVDFGDGRGCVPQDSLTFEGLQSGEVNEIVRFYRDKAGNEASDVVYVMAKNTKDVDISVEKPVTTITQDDVDKYYASKEPEKGQTFAISIYNPQTEKEIETMVGGSFKNKEAAHDSVYPGLKGHLGPTLGIQAKVPVINSVDGLATLDDLVGDDGLILLDAVDAVGSKKVTVEEFVKDHCDADFRGDLGSDISKANLYNTEMKAKIWVYTSLGQFVDYFGFTQELNDPSYASDAGVLTLYFEMKPDKNGDLHTDSGRLYATRAYIYKTEITMSSKLHCDLPPFDDASNKNVMGQKKKVTEDLLKSFGYKRPTSKK